MRHIRRFGAHHLPARSAPGPQSVKAQSEGSTRVWAPEQVFQDLRDGWSYIFLNPTVRTVNLALAVG